MENLENLRIRLCVAAIAGAAELAYRTGNFPYGAQDVWSAYRRLENLYALLPETARQQVINLWEQLGIYLAGYYQAPPGATSG